MTPPSSTQPISRDERFVSVASRLALLTWVLIASASFVVALVITRQARVHFFDSKERAGLMLCQLLASSVAPALDFGDGEAVAASLRMLSENNEVVDAAVWGIGALPSFTRLRSDGAPLGPNDQVHGVRITEEHIDVAMATRSPAAKPLGTVWVRLSLAKEIARFSATRMHVLSLAFIISTVVVALLVAVLRRTVVSPLAKLEAVARQLGQGELEELTGLRNDEIGSLGRTFNRMGRAIREREDRIRAVNARLQSLLDNMRQAIVVFDDRGHLATERSRLAQEIFGANAGETSDITSVLFPSGASDIEREAFQLWLAQAEKADGESLEQLGELAPKEAKVTDVHGTDRLLELEFRRVTSEHSEQAIMLLATDVTSERNLARSAQTREREHQKQLVAMRRLLAGGAQVFVDFLKGAREGVLETERELSAVTTLTPTTTESVFRFVHTLRAEARSFELTALEQLAVRLEVELAGARHAPADSPLRRAAYGKLREGCVDLARELTAAEELFVANSPIGRRALEQLTVSRADVDDLFLRLGQRKDEIGRLVSRLAGRPFGAVMAMLPDAVRRWAANAGKSVDLMIRGPELIVPRPLSERLSGVLAHLLRNAIAHGIEPPDVRRERQKPEMGRIEVTCKESPAGVVITVSDDGDGFDIEALSARKPQGAANGLESAFAPGISTRSSADELAGFGVGLTAVREELLQVGYLTRILSNRGEGATALLEPMPRCLEPGEPCC